MLHIIHSVRHLFVLPNRFFEKSSLLVYFCFISFFYKGFKDEKNVVDFSASLSVANEVKALYCRSACNKERMETVESPVKVCVEFTQV